MSTNNMDDVELPLSKANGGTGVIVSTTLVQTVTTTISATNTAATTAFGTTAPTTSEGAQIATLSITPVYSTSVLDIYAEINLNGSPTALSSSVMALHRDGANAIATASWGLARNNCGQQLCIRKIITSGSTAATTFTLRVGTSSATNTLSINSYNAAGLFNGVAITYFIIREYLA